MNSGITLQINWKHLVNAFAEPVPQSRACNITNKESGYVFSNCLKCRGCLSSIEKHYEGSVSYVVGMVCLLFTILNFAFECLEMLITPISLTLNLVMKILP